MKKSLVMVIFVLTGLMFYSCGGEGDPSRDNESPADSDTVMGDDDITTLYHGFDIRKPGSKTFRCKNEFMSEEMIFPDGDHFCTFSYKEMAGYIYFRATAKGCEDNGMSFGAAYETTGWISFNDQAELLEKASYDWGGNHQNDAFSFTYKGTPYTFFHSTFGPGWRKCQPMDCLQIYKSDETILEDGCTEERTLPVTCVRINEDGTVPPLPETFKKCDEMNPGR